MGKLLDPGGEMRASIVIRRVVGDWVSRVNFLVRDETRSRRHGRNPPLSSPHVLLIRNRYISPWRFIPLPSTLLYWNAPAVATWQLWRCTNIPFHRTSRTSKTTITNYHPGGHLSTHTHNHHKVPPPLHTPPSYLSAASCSLSHSHTHSSLTPNPLPLNLAKLHRNILPLISIISWMLIHPRISRLCQRLEYMMLMLMLTTTTTSGSRIEGQVVIRCGWWWWCRYGRERRCRDLSLETEWCAGDVLVAWCRSVVVLVVRRVRRAEEGRGWD